MKAYTYLIIDLACIAVPFIFSFYKKHAFYKEWRYFFPANMLVALVFLLWDAWFTKLGVWGFNPDYLSGLYLGNLPLEEVLFFTCIPYACIFTYFALKYLIPEKNDKHSKRYISLFLLVVSGLAAILFYSKSYTFYTSVLLFLVLTIVQLKKIDIKYIVFSYITIIPFFFLSNGILTGSFLEAPIVWYNNNENVSLRLFTIPIEDVFYGFLLILSNILLYEALKKLPLQKSKF